MADVTTCVDDLAFEADVDELYDPLAEDGPGEEDAAEQLWGEPEFVPQGADNLGAAPASPDASAPRDERPASERIADLFEEMGLRRHTLGQIIELCREPRPAHEVNEQVDALQAHRYSVFSAADLTGLLEEAGALERVTEDGTPYAQVRIEPRTVERDGVEYLEPGQAPAVFWRATADGLASLACDDPLARIEATFEEEPQYLPVYRRVLELCACDEGCPIGAIGAAVDDDPLLSSPRLFAAHFVERLERCDALAWEGSWRTTDAGLEALAELDGVGELRAGAPAREERDAEEGTDR